MDVSIILVFVVLFFVACITLFGVYKFGIKEKSYEEALAEQRQQTNALLGARAKPKDKKNKKVVKKQKDKEQKVKTIVPEKENIENEEPKLVEFNAPNEKPHVDFKEEPDEVIVPPVKPKSIKKARPILVKKEKSPVRVDLLDAEIAAANHFEENPPKDDFELFSTSKDEGLKPEPVKEKNLKDKKNASEANPQVRSKKDKTAKISNNPVQLSPVSEPVVKEVQEKPVENVPVTLPTTNGVVIGNPGKEKKKKKTEFNAKQQMSSDRDGLLNSVRKAELSKTEIQMLIDLLLNKQLDGPGTVVDDWTEGKSDPVQKLKRQLAEKEKALEEEQQALVGAQTKLKEIRSEQQAERQQLQQKIRGLEELAQAKQLEAQAAANRLQVGAQQVQQLKTELNAEIMKARKLMEDNASLQRQLQQIQESESVLTKLRNDYEDLSAQNQQLRVEKQQIVGEQEHQHQHFLVQMGNLEKALEQQNELNRQLQESSQKLERKLEIAVRQHDEKAIENNSLKAGFQQHFEEKMKLERTLRKMSEELRVITNEKMESTEIIGQLTRDIQLLQDEMVKLKLNADDGQHEVEILNLNNELSSIKNELNMVKSQLQQADNKLETSNKQYLLIQKELEEQKEKNNELRKKNWKVMEALKVAENRMGSNVDKDKLTKEIVSREQEMHRQFIQRLFPEVDDLKSVTSENWQDEFGNIIKIYVKGLKENQKSASVPSSPEKTEVTKLQAQLQHYKKIIDDTEGMLNKLQVHVEKEEINWRNEQTTKDAEIERLKKEISRLEEKLTQLESELNNEVDQKHKLVRDVQSMENTSGKVSQDQTATIEKMSEEINRLREILRQEQAKKDDAAVCIKPQNSCNNSVNGSNFIEHCLSSSSSLASSMIEGLNKKPKSKKRKKKVPALRNANICSNMGCQFLYCDGNGCQGGL